MAKERVPPAPKPENGLARPLGGIRVIATSTLYASAQREPLRRHGGRKSRLRLTRDGKLILI